MNYFIILGYVVFTVYTVGIMALGSILEAKTSFNKVVIRKLTHIISSFVWVICYIFFKCSIHWVLLNGIGAALLGILTFTGKINFEADNKSYGIFYFGLVTFIVALITYFIGPEVYLYTGIAYYCLALGDGFAPIIAIALKGKNPVIREGKTLFGTLSVFLFSLISTTIFVLVLKMHLPVLLIFAIASLTCVVEFYGIKGLDNILIDFAVYGLLLLYHFGLTNDIFLIGIIISPFMAMGAIKKKLLSYTGGVMALVFLLAVTFFVPDYIFVLFTCALFIVEGITSVVSNKKGGKHKAEGEGRTGIQVFAVCGISLVFAVISYFIGNKETMIFLAYLALLEQFSDAMSSNIGVLSKGKNIDIVRFRPVEKGISGGISFLGTITALIVCLVFPLILLCTYRININKYLFIALIAFLGNIIDSILGSVIQVLYKCEVCDKLTEEKNHCGKPVVRIKGIKFVDNRMVNFLAGLITCAIGAFV